MLDGDEVRVDAVRTLGHYEDELVREGGEWRFARRFAPMDMPAA